MNTQLPTTAGRIAAVAPEGLAAELDLRPGDELLAVNGHPLRDVIDVHFYGAEDALELLVRRDDELYLYEVARDYAQPLGLTFTHPTFDVDIRRCDNRCAFCFVLQMAPGMRRTLYTKDDDYRYSFLQGNYVTLTNLSEEDWSRIAEQGLSPLYVSVHATETALRRQLLGNPEAPDVMAQLRRLAGYGVAVHTQIVVTPGLNDGPHLDRSLRDLATLWPAARSVSVVPVGITKHHKYGLRPHTQAEARAVFDQVSAWQARFVEQLGVRFAYLTDEWYLLLEEPVPLLAAYDGLALQENGLGGVRDFLDEWATLKHSLHENIDRAIQHLTLVTGTLFTPTLTRVAAAFARRTGIAVTVQPVVNRRLGATITVAGLLMGQDVIQSLQTPDEDTLGQWVALPRVMFDHPDGIALDDVSPEQIAQAIGRPVILADGMADLWHALASPFHFPG